MRSRSNDPRRLQPVLLIKNLETILDAITALLGDDPLPRKPRPIERERILHRFVHRSTPDQRLELTRRVPSLAYLLEKLASAVAELDL